MPRFDETGPTGIGPRTGGGFGCCPPGTGTAANTPLRGIGRGGSSWGGGRGRSWGNGRGKGFLGSCRGFFRTQRMPLPDEEAVLADRASAFEEELAAIREQLTSIRKDSNGKKE